MYRTSVPCLVSVHFYGSIPVRLWHMIPSCGGNHALIFHLKECCRRRLRLAAMNYGHLWRYLVF
jgi:hypothetical protein